MVTSSSKIPPLKRPPTELLRLHAALQQASAFASSYKNNAKLWTMVRNALDQLLVAEWRAGRLLGTRPSEAYFVRCDASTMTQVDIANGRMVATVGVATLKPAEFELLTVVQQTAT